MVQESKRMGQSFYLCDVCGFGYADQEAASQCENYCRKHNQCSIEITKKAIYRPSHY